MTSLLDKISVCKATVITDLWETGQTAAIVDFQGDNVFRFVEYENEHRLLNKHLTAESILSCPVVAKGFIGYWLHKRKATNIKTIFEDYYNLQLEEYIRCHDSDDDAWNRDLRMEYEYYYHIDNEKNNREFTKALYAYVTISDKQKIESVYSNYFAFARRKRNKLNHLKHLPNQEIEDTFIDVYRIGGPAEKCITWMRDEYKLPLSRSNRHDKIIPDLVEADMKLHNAYRENIREGYEDFDDNVLWNGKLMDEINENLKKCHTYEDRVRYLITILQPFKTFAAAFDAKAAIDERNLYINETLENIKKLEEEHDRQDDIYYLQNYIENYKKDIIYFKEVQERFFNFAQHAITEEYAPEEDHEMCKYLCRWWHCMIMFARRLAALFLLYDINLLDVQEECKVYLVSNLLITDYVDNYFITSFTHARKLLANIERKKKQMENDTCIISNRQRTSNKQFKKNSVKSKTNTSNKFPKTLKYFIHGNKGTLKKQKFRVNIIFKKFTEWGWIDKETSTDEFFNLFEGEPRHCNITWKGTTTILTILMKELIKQKYIIKQNGCKATSMVKQQFELTPNFDKNRLDEKSFEKIKISLCILDIDNPLPESHGGYDKGDEYDTSDEALNAIYSGLLHSTKRI